MQTLCRHLISVLNPLHATSLNNFADIITILIFSLQMNPSRPPELISSNNKLDNGPRPGVLQASQI